ncbi:hypothetical protein [Streptomyces sp. NPDC053755]|uniref:hypothetical protein n=1 Tax=Streptomyces sp. NPDC053755 TaxID=3155815 RepID=UPI0034426E0C
MDFVFMLTRDDRTVTDCLDVLDQLDALDRHDGPEGPEGRDGSHEPDGPGDLDRRDLLGLGRRDTVDVLGGAEAPHTGRTAGIARAGHEARVDHIGFKDVGVDTPTLARLHRRIKDRGATSYLEVVSTTREEALASARTAVDLGVDWLMGGTWVEETLTLLDGTGTRYLPFAGEPLGHPTRLAGGPSRIADDCRRAEAAGCAGVDLLAYRAVDADPLDLVRAARAATTGRLVVAGSITTPARIRALAEAGADAFTIGSAAFSGSLRPDAGTLGAQLTTILEATAAAVAAGPPRRAPEHRPGPAPSPGGPEGRPVTPPEALTLEK